MKKRVLFGFLSLVLFSCAPAPVSDPGVSNDYGWTKRIGGTDSESGNCVTSDSAGNVYLTGDFFYTVNFAADWGGTNEKTSAGLADIFVTKVNANGTYAWTKMIGGTANDHAYSITADSSGNVYLTGYFNGGPVNFAADWSGTDNYTSAGLQDIFVTKISNNGEYCWTMMTGGAGSDYGNSITVDLSGNVYLTGYFSAGPVDFAAEWGGIDNKTSAGNTDIFVTRINDDGTYGWTKVFGGTDYDQGYSVAADSSGNLYLTGFFKGTINFAGDWAGTDNKTSAGLYDIYVTKITVNGVYGWTKRIGGTSDDYGYSIAADSSGNVYLAGYFNGTVNFAGDWSGTDNKTNAGLTDIFVTKINANGSYGWTKQIGGTGDDRAYSVSVDSAGNVYLTGNFSGTVNFALGWGGTDNKTSAGGIDGFVTKVNANGTYGWTKQIGGADSDYGSSVETDSSGNIYFTGNFFGTVNFAAGWGKTDNKTSATSVTYGDIFLTKIKP